MEKQVHENKVKNSKETATETASFNSYLMRLRRLSYDDIIPVVKKNFSIGRMGCTYNLRSMKVTRNHCEINFQHGKVFITNSSTAKLTVINEKRLNTNESVELKVGDLLGIGCWPIPERQYESDEFVFKLEKVFMQTISINDEKEKSTNLVDSQEIHSTLRRCNSTSESDKISSKPDSLEKNSKEIKQNCDLHLNRRSRKLSTSEIRKKTKNLAVDTKISEISEKLGIKLNETSKIIELNSNELNKNHKNLNDLSLTNDESEKSLDKNFITAKNDVIKGSNAGNRKSIACSVIKLHSSIEDTKKIMSENSFNKEHTATQRNKNLMSNEENDETEKVNQSERKEEFIENYGEYSIMKNSLENCSNSNEKFQSMTTEMQNLFSSISEGQNQAIIIEETQKSENFISSNQNVNNLSQTYENSFNISKVDEKMTQKSSNNCSKFEPISIYQILNENKQKAIITDIQIIKPPHHVETSQKIQQSTKERFTDEFQKFLILPREPKTKRKIEKTQIAFSNSNQSQKIKMMSSQNIEKDQHISEISLNNLSVKSNSQIPQNIKLISSNDSVFQQNVINVAPVQPNSCSIQQYVPVIVSNQNFQPTATISQNSIPFAQNIVLTNQNVQVQKKYLVVSPNSVKIQQNGQNLHPATAMNSKIISSQPKHHTPNIDVSKIYNNPQTFDPSIIVQPAPSTGSEFNAHSVLSNNQTNFYTPNVFDLSTNSFGIQNPQITSNSSKFITELNQPAAIISSVITPTSNLYFILPQNVNFNQPQSIVVPNESNLTKSNLLNTENNGIESLSRMTKTHASNVKFSSLKRISNLTETSDLFQNGLKSKTSFENERNLSQQQNKKSFEVSNLKETRTIQRQNDFKNPQAAVESQGEIIISNREIQIQSNSSQNLTNLQEVSSDSSQILENLKYVDENFKKFPQDSPQNSEKLSTNVSNLFLEIKKLFQNNSKDQNFPLEIRRFLAKVKNKDDPTKTTLEECILIPKDSNNLKNSYVFINHNYKEGKKINNEIVDQNEINKNDLILIGDEKVFENETILNLFENQTNEKDLTILKQSEEIKGNQNFILQISNENMPKFLQNNEVLANENQILEHEIKENQTKKEKSSYAENSQNLRNITVENYENSNSSSNVENENSMLRKILTSTPKIEATKSFTRTYSSSNNCYTNPFESLHQINSEICNRITNSFNDSQIFTRSKSESIFENSKPLKSLKKIQKTEKFPLMNNDSELKEKKTSKRVTQSQEEYSKIFKPTENNFKNSEIVKEKLKNLISRRRNRNQEVILTQKENNLTENLNLNQNGTRSNQNNKQAEQLSEEKVSKEFSNSILFETLTKDTKINYSSKTTLLNENITQNPIENLQSESNVETEIDLSKNISNEIETNIPIVKVLNDSNSNEDSQNVKVQNNLMINSECFNNCQSLQDLKTQNINQNESKNHQESLRQAEVKEFETNSEKVQDFQNPNHQNSNYFQNSLQFKKVENEGNKILTKTQQNNRKISFSTIKLKVAAPKLEKIQIIERKIYKTRKTKISDETEEKEDQNCETKQSDFGFPNKTNIKNLENATNGIDHEKLKKLHLESLKSIKLSRKLQKTFSETFPIIKLEKIKVLNSKNIQEENLNLKQIDDKLTEKVIEIKNSKVQTKTNFERSKINNKEMNLNNDQKMTENLNSNNSCSGTDSLESHEESHQNDKTTNGIFSINHHQPYQNDSTKIIQSTQNNFETPTKRSRGRPKKLFNEPVYGPVRKRGRPMKCCYKNNEGEGSEIMKIHEQKISCLIENSMRRSSRRREMTVKMRELKQRWKKQNNSISMKSLSTEGSLEEEKSEEILNLNKSLTENICIKSKKIDQNSDKNCHEIFKQTTQRENLIFDQNTEHLKSAEIQFESASQNQISSNFNKSKNSNLNDFENFAINGEMIVLSSEEIIQSLYQQLQSKNSSILNKNVENIELMSSSSINTLKLDHGEEKLQNSSSINFSDVQILNSEVIRNSSLLNTQNQQLLDFKSNLESSNVNEVAQTSLNIESKINSIHSQETTLIQAEENQNTIENKNRKSIDFTNNSSKEEIKEDRENLVENTNKVLNSLFEINSLPEINLEDFESALSASNETSSNFNNEESNLNSVQEDYKSNNKLRNQKLENSLQAQNDEQNLEENIKESLQNSINHSSQSVNENYLIIDTKVIEDVLQETPDKTLTMNTFENISQPLQDENINREILQKSKETTNENSNRKTKNKRKNENLQNQVKKIRFSRRLLSAGESSKFTNFVTELEKELKNKTIKSSNFILQNQFIERSNENHEMTKENKTSEIPSQEYFPSDITANKNEKIQNIEIDKISQNDEFSNQAVKISENCENLDSSSTINEIINNDSNKVEKTLEIKSNKTEETLSSITSNIEVQQIKRKRGRPKGVNKKETKEAKDEISTKRIKIIETKIKEIDQSTEEVENSSKFNQEVEENSIIVQQNSSDDETLIDLFSKQQEDNKYSFKKDGKSSILKSSLSIQQEEEEIDSNQNKLVEEIINFEEKSTSLTNPINIESENHQNGDSERESCSTIKVFDSVYFTIYKEMSRVNRRTKNDIFISKDSTHDWINDCEVKISLKDKIETEQLIANEEMQVENETVNDLKSQIEINENLTREDSKLIQKSLKSSKINQNSKEIASKLNLETSKLKSRKNSEKIKICQKSLKNSKISKSFKKNQKEIDEVRNFEQTKEDKRNSNESFEIIEEIQKNHSEKSSKICNSPKEVSNGIIQTNEYSQNTETQLNFINKEIIQNSINSSGKVSNAENDDKNNKILNELNGENFEQLSLLNQKSCKEIKKEKFKCEKILNENSQKLNSSEESIKTQNSIIELRNLDQNSQKVDENLLDDDEISPFESLPSTSKESPDNTQKKQNSIVIHSIVCLPSLQESLKSNKNEIPQLKSFNFHEAKDEDGEAYYVEESDEEIEICNENDTNQKNIENSHEEKLNENHEEAESEIIFDEEILEEDKENFDEFESEKGEELCKSQEEIDIENLEDNESSLKDVKNLDEIVEVLDDSEDEEYEFDPEKAKKIEVVYENDLNLNLKSIMKTDNKGNKERNRQKVGFKYVYIRYISDEE